MPRPSATVEEDPSEEGTEDGESLSERDQRALDAIELNSDLGKVPERRTKPPAKERRNGVSVPQHSLDTPAKPQKVVLLKRPQERLPVSFSQLQQKDDRVEVSKKRSREEAPQERNNGLSSSRHDREKERGSNKEELREKPREEVRKVVNSSQHPAVANKASSGDLPAKDRKDRMGVTSSEPHHEAKRAPPREVQMKEAPRREVLTKVPPKEAPPVSVTKEAPPREVRTKDDRKNTVPSHPRLEAGKPLQKVDSWKESGGIPTKELRKDVPPRVVTMKDERKQTSVNSHVANRAPAREVAVKNSREVEKAKAEESEEESEEEDDEDEEEEEASNEGEDDDEEASAPSEDDKEKEEDKQAAKKEADAEEKGKTARAAEPEAESEAEEEKAEEEEEGEEEQEENQEQEEDDGEEAGDSSRRGRKTSQDRGGQRARTPAGSEEEEKDDDEEDGDEEEEEEDEDSRTCRTKGRDRGRDRDRDRRGCERSSKVRRSHPQEVEGGSGRRHRRGSGEPSDRERKRDRREEAGRTWEKDGDRHRRRSRGHGHSRREEDRRGRSEGPGHRPYTQRSPRHRSRRRSRSRHRRHRTRSRSRDAHRQSSPTRQPPSKDAPPSTSTALVLKTSVKEQMAEVASAGGPAPSKEWLAALQGGGPPAGVIPGLSAVEPLLTLGVSSAASISPVAALGNFGGRAAGIGSPGANDAIGAFCRASGVDQRAEIALRGLPPQLAAEVIAQGPILGVNSSAILMVRVHKAEQVNMQPKLSLPRPGFLAAAAEQMNLPPQLALPMSNAPASADAISSFIASYGIDSSAETALRALPPELQRQVISDGPLRGLNASALLMSRIRRVQETNGSAQPAGGLITRSAL